MEPKWNEVLKTLLTVKRVQQFITLRRKLQACASDFDGILKQDEEL